MRKNLLNHHPQVAANNEYERWQVWEIDEFVQSRIDEFDHLHKCP